MIVGRRTEGGIAGTAKKEYCNQGNNHAKYSQAYGCGKNPNLSTVIDKIFYYESPVTSQPVAGGKDSMAIGSGARVRSVRP